MAARTKLVYQQRGDLHQYLSKILSISPVSTLPAADQSLIKNASEEDYALITDETIFYVQGGGQPSDTGTIEPASSKSDATPVFEVNSVRYPAVGGAILHFGRFKPTTAASAAVPNFRAGTQIQQNIDDEKRHLFSRLHTAGHILGLAINALSREGVLPPLVEGKASHYPDSAAVEFGGLIEGRHKDAIQAKTDEFVRSASKVLIHWWPMEKLLTDCTGVTEGFELPEGETEGRVVEMEGLGAYPCGGTHVTDCSKVGKIEVKKISRSKGVSRVSYRVS
jgi:Ser-tRNA(Ala) deacylase AlaX